MANCLTGVCEPERTQGLQVQPAQGQTFVMVTLKGPGIFLGSEMTKQGGNNDLTFVSLDIDGRNVVNLSFAAAANAGLTQQNPFGVVLLKSNALKNFTIGFPSPLRYERELKLSAIVNEAGVAQLVANVVHGKG